MLNKPPFFSIIIPTFNRANTVGKTIHSIFNQSFEDIEVIVVDDGSSDDTASVVASFRNKIRYVRIKNSERGAARNYGLSLSNGKYVNFFDSDDLFTPSFNALYQFLKEGQVPVVYGDFKLVDPNGIQLVKDKNPYQSFTENLLHNNFMACGAVFLLREVAIDFKFNTDRRLSSAEDWELWLRVHTTHKFTHFSKIIFQQVQHSERSLMAIHPEKVEARDNYFVELVLRNKELISFYGEKALNLFIADRYTFIALAFCLHDRKKSLYYLKKSFVSSLRILGRKRFWAVLRKNVLQ